MADEATTQTEEEISGQVEEGSVASLEVETEEAPEVVPARDLLRVKEQRDTYKSQLKEKDDLIKSLQSKNQEDEDDDLSGFQDLDPEFKKKWEAKDKKSERIATEIVERRLAEERRKIDFERKLETTIDKQLDVARKNGVRIPDSFDRNLFKTIVLSQPKTDIAVLAERTWWVDVQAKATSENDARPAMDYLSETVSINSLSPEKREKVLQDEGARKAYFNALDQAGR